MVELVRTWAFAYRNVIMARRNVFFVFELTFWPGVAMLSHGLLTRFLHLDARMTAFILVGTVYVLGRILVRLPGHDRHLVEVVGRHR